MKKANILILLITMGWIACKSHSSKNVKQVLLKPGKVITVPLDSSTSSVWFCIESFSYQNQEFVVYQDKIKTDPDFVHFHCMADASRSFKVPFYKEGSNGVGNIDGFHIHNLDSIFVINRYKYMVYLVDSRGDIKKSYPLIKEAKIGVNTSLPWVSTASKMFLWQDTLYIPAFPDVGPPKNDYRKPQLMIALSLKSGIFNYKIAYPEEYKKVFWGYDHTQISTSWNKNQKSLIISFPVHHSLFVEDLKSGKIIEKKLPKSKLVNILKPLEKYSDEFEIYTKLQLSNDKYHSVEYDPYRDIYYRFCIEHYDKEAIGKILNGENTSNIPRKSIMVLNNRFEFISETLLPQNDYTIQYMFINKEGLYISKREDNDAYKTFQLFTLDTVQ